MSKLQTSNFKLQISAFKLQISNFKLQTSTFLCCLLALALSSCKKTNLEDQAAHIAEEYTERNCPTPKQDMTITDSITFDRNSLTFGYYYTLTDDADNAEAIRKIEGKLTKSLLKSLKENTSMKIFKDAGYNFRYIFRSEKTGDVIFAKVFTKKNYGKK